MEPLAVTRVVSKLVGWDPRGSTCSKTSWYAGRAALEARRGLGLVAIAKESCSRVSYEGGRRPRWGAEEGLSP